jgi:hypothetical protein
MPEGELVVIHAVNSEDSVQSPICLRIGALSWKGIVEARFFCNFWRMSIISIPGQQEGRTAGGRTKEIRNERI